MHACILNKYTREKRNTETKRGAGNMKLTLFYKNY